MENETYPSQDLNIFLKSPKQAAIFLGNFAIGFLQKVSFEIDSEMMFPRIEARFPSLNFHLANWPDWVLDRDCITISLKKAMQDNRDVDILVSGNVVVSIGKTILGGLVNVKYVGDMMGAEKGNFSQLSITAIDKVWDKSVVVPDWVDFTLI